MKINQNKKPEDRVSLVSGLKIGDSIYRTSRIDTIHASTYYKAIIKDIWDTIDKNGNMKSILENDSGYPEEDSEYVVTQEAVDNRVKESAYTYYWDRDKIFRPKVI